MSERRCGGERIDVLSVFAGDWMARPLHQRAGLLDRGGRHFPVAVQQASAASSFVRIGLPFPDDPSCSA